MSDLSNRTIATILVISIVISLSTTLVSLQRMGGITGMASTDQETGTASVTVQSSVSILLTTDTVNFGTGYVNGSNPTCNTNGVNLSTEGAGINQDDCFINASDVAPAKLATDFVINNDGTINASVTIVGPNKTYLFGASDGSNYNFSWRGSEASNACYGTLTESWTAFGPSTQLCDDFNWADSDDDLTVAVNLRFPSSQGAGTYSNSTIEFNAVQA